jgi:hypothetical protein
MTILIIIYLAGYLLAWIRMGFGYYPRPGIFQGICKFLGNKMGYAIFWPFISVEELMRKVLSAPY